MTSSRANLLSAAAQVEQATASLRAVFDKPGLSRRHAAIVKLLAAGAIVGNIRWETRGSDTKTPLDLALDAKDWELFRILAEAVSEEPLEASRKLATMVLSRAAATQSLDAIAAALSAPCGRLPESHYALTPLLKSDNVAAARMILEAGTKLDPSASVWLSSEARSVEMLDLLIAHGFDPTWTTEHGENALQRMVQMHSHQPHAPVMAAAFLERGSPREVVSRHRGEVMSLLEWAIGDHRRLPPELIKVVWDGQPWTRTASPDSMVGLAKAGVAIDWGDSIKHIRSWLSMDSLSRTTPEDFEVLVKSGLDVDAKKPGAEHSVAVECLRQTSSGEDYEGHDPEGDLAAVLKLWLAVGGNVGDLEYWGDHYGSEVGAVVSDVANIERGRALRAARQLDERIAPAPDALRPRM